MNYYRTLDDELRPLKEGKWYPTIAIGLNAPIRHINDRTNDNKYFMNFYLVATKHIDLKRHKLHILCYTGTIGAVFDFFVGTSSTVALSCCTA